ncbi:MAG: transcriptional regulator [Deltaproteobacteria bacterium]|nr:transcriptional regulator [Deltaproteobacteria bacterium]
MEVKPIRTQADYRAALRNISSLLDAPEGSKEVGMLEVLSVLVEAYEEEHHPVDPPDPIEAIKFRMDQIGFTHRDLEPYLGSRARVSEVLNRKRTLSVEMIRRLNAGLGIPAEILIRPYKAGRAA